MKVTSLIRSLGSTLVIVALAASLVMACGGEEVVEEVKETIEWGYTGAGAP